ncbi:2-oxoacid:acceptor oxidoreductase family protein [Streptomyces phaeochromogenes]
MREPVVEPDAVVFQDATPLHQVNVFDGLRSDASVLVDSPRPIEEPGPSDLSAVRASGRAPTVPVSALALLIFGRPVPGAVLLGGLAEAGAGIGRRTSLPAGGGARILDAVALPAGVEGGQPPC